MSKTAVTGLVATTPRHLVTQDGLPITSFRIAEQVRTWDKAKDGWVDGGTNWFTVTAFRDLAVNAAGSISKGDRVVVVGDLVVRDWDNGERAGTSIEINASSIGHDMAWGTSDYKRAPIKWEGENN